MPLLSNMELRGIEKGIERGAVQTARESVMTVLRLRLTQVQAIDSMMTLPQELQQSFEERLNCYEESRKMPLLSNMELRGIEKGIEKGTRQTLQSNIISLLQKRFETVPSELVEAINNIENVSELQSLLLETVSINSVANFQQLLTQNLRSQGE